MDSLKEKFIEQKASIVIKALEENNMNGFFAKTAEDAKKIAEKLLNPRDVVSHGGSVTLKECGIIDLLKSGDYTYLDRSAPDLTSEQIMDIYRKTFFADVYLASTNAVTVNGELYNVDGNSNEFQQCFSDLRKLLLLPVTIKL